MSSRVQLSSAATGASSVPPKVFEYEVLYYQRSNKVHKSKGVSKFDGVLSITVATGAIRLKNSDFDDDEDESDDDNDDGDDNGRTSKKKSYAKKKKQQKQKQGSQKAVPYSGKDKALAQRCCGGGGNDNHLPSLQNDDTIVLGGFEVQIVSCLTTVQQPRAKVLPMGKNRLASKYTPSSLTTTTTTNNNKRPAVGLASVNQAVVRRKMVAKPLHSDQRSVGLLTSSTSASLPRKPLQTSSNTHSQQLARRTGPLQSRASTLLANSQTKKKRPSLHTKSSTATTTIPASASAAANTICPGIPLPASIRTVMRPHQVEGVEFLWQALTMGPRKGAILADEMGLGKTLMTIATIMGMHRKDREKHFIVVCPSSLVSNWAKEFDKWVGKASQPKRVVIQKGDADSISRLKSVYSSTRSMGGQVLILSYELFRRVTNNFNAKTKIGLLVVDEGHRLKNQEGLTLAALESLSCEARLCITATPVQNNLREFYNLASFVRPGVLGEATIFRKDYERPITAANQKNASREQKAKGKEQAKALDALIKPFMLRRLQKDVLKSMLPPRTEVLLFCRPTSAQCRIYENLCSEATSTSMSTEALVSLGNLRKLCAHPSLLNATTEGTKAADVALSGKLTVLESLLYAIRNENEKVVIVSNYTSVLSLIESSILKPKQLPFARLDGSTDQSDRQGLVDTFNRANSSVFAFLLSSKAGGCGLNLIGASRLVMFDADWNPATDTQAAARIYRPGQTKPCYIYRMFTTGTVEEVILQRQIAKESLAVFDGTKSNEKFNKEELKDCFTLKNCDCDTKRKLGKTWLDYTGPESLQGSNDGPLLEICGSTSDTLSFVHIVEEKENETTDSPGPASQLLDSDSGDESDSADDDDEAEDEEEESDEEMEF